MDNHFKAIQDDLIQAMDDAAFLCARDQMKGLQHDALGREYYGRLKGLVQAYHILQGNEIDPCRLRGYANQAIEYQLANMEGAA
jgi:hypothetical protein